MRNRPTSVAMAAASPILKLLKAFLYSNTGSVIVELTGPPRVVIQIIANVLKFHTNPKKKTNPTMEPINGKVRNRKICQELAPSILMASYNSLEIV